jgi:hypothetical protein
VFRSAIQRAGLRLEVDWDDLGEPVYLDREMWEKVVLNLLSNALKFTLDGHIAVTVSSGSSLPTLSSTAARRAPRSASGCPRQPPTRRHHRHHRAVPGPTPLRRHPPSCTSIHNPAAGGAWNCAANSTWTRPPGCADPCWVSYPRRARPSSTCGL